MMPAQVDLWVLPLSCCPPDSSLLDADGRARWAALQREPDRRRFVGGALLIRAVAAAWLGQPSEQVSVSRRCRQCGGPHGKPEVVGGPQISVSHAGDLVVLASCADRPVGVDVEPVGADPGPGVAELVLAPSERRYGVGPDELMRSWVRKEAVLKAVGVGLSVAPTEVVVSAAAEPARVLAHPFPDVAQIALADVQLAGHLCSVAVIGPAGPETGVHVRVRAAASWRQPIVTG